LPRLLDRADPEARLIWLIAIGRSVRVVAGLSFKHPDRGSHPHAAVAAACWLLGACCFFVAGARRVQGPAPEGIADAGGGVADWLRAAARCSGCLCDRSRPSPLGDLFIGLRRALRARFIFPLAIPAILARGGDRAEAAQCRPGDHPCPCSDRHRSSAIVFYVPRKLFHSLPGSHSLDAFRLLRLALAATLVVWLWRA